MSGLTRSVGRSGRKGQTLLAVLAAPTRRLAPTPAAATHSLRPRPPRPITTSERPRAQRARRARLVRQTEPFLMMAVACALIALLATLYLTEDNKAALMTYQINTLQNQQSALLRTQGDLRLQLDQLEALQRVQGEANSLGMVAVQPTSTTFIDLPPVVDTVAAPRPIAEAK